MSDIVIGHFRRWLRSGMTGCSFASALSRRLDRTGIVAFEQAPPSDELDSLLDGYGAAQMAAFVVLPNVRDQAGLVAILNGLVASSPRWKLRRYAAERGAPVRVGLDWITASGDASDTMGFAPFSEMPVPRRAPYVAIGTWPGGRANPLRGVGVTPPSRPGQVSFLDAAHGLDDDAYDGAWTTTSTAVGHLMALPVDDARRYRRVSFVLGAEATSALAA